MAQPGNGRSRQSWSIAITPLSAARSAFGLGKALDQAGWHVIPTSNAASLAESALVCVVILSPQTVSDPQVVAAMSAKFAALIPVVTTTMALPDAPWSCQAFSLSALDAQQAATGVAIAKTLTRLLSAASQPPQSAPIQPLAATPAAAAPVAPPGPLPALTPATNWTPASRAPLTGESRYGRLIEEFPGNPRRFIRVGLGVLFLLAGITGCAGIGEWDTTSRWILSVVGVGLVMAFYSYSRGAHALLFEHGFIISRAGKSTGARWEEIANIEHWSTTTRVYGIIPTGTRNWYKVILKSGERVSIRAEVNNAARLCEQIEIKWREALRRAGA